MMFRSLGLLVAAPLMVMLAGPASAKTIPLGTLSPVGGIPFEMVAGSATPFVEIYTFTLPYEEQIVLSSVTTTSASGKGDIDTALTGGEFELFSGVPKGSLVDSAAIVIDPFTKAYYASLSDKLYAGTYYVEVTGTFDPEKLVKIGKKTSYVTDTSAVLGESGNYSVTAVPEVSTWAMMWFGFAGLGLAGYRSQRNAGNRSQRKIFHQVA